MRMEELVLEFPGYGYRRVTRQLQREGWYINHKRVLTLMRAHGLLCLPRKRWIATTDSVHGLEVYPNLVPQMEVARLDQLWVADLTYIRLPQGFCYLAVILDAFSRKVIGWELSHWLDARVAVTALERALQARQPAPGLVHHSDRGVQYACRNYIDLLLTAGARISMSGRGRPRDNAQAESFFRTLKMEEVYLQEYQSFEEASVCIDQFITAVYNRKRFHSSLGYVPPEEFEASILSALAA
jgi:transposase InsO family protein